MRQFAGHSTGVTEAFEAVDASFARDLERKLNRANALLMEMKAAIKFAKFEAKERLHRLDQAASERTSWLESREKMKRERDEARETITRLNRKLTKAEGIIAAAGLVENRPKSGGGTLGRALANYSAEQWKDIADKSIGYVYENDWDPWACDIIKDYEKLAGAPHPIHSK